MFVLGLFKGTGGAGQGGALWRLPVMEQVDNKEKVEKGKVFWCSSLLKAFSRLFTLKGEKEQ